MGRTPCCDSDANVKKGPWTTEEDEKLKKYIEENGAGNWRNLPKLAGLNRCGKSCRLRWANYLRPDIKRGIFSEEEEQLIIHFHSTLGNKWSTIAARLPGRTDNEIKNYWNTHLRKQLLKMGIDPVTHRPRTDLNLLAGIPNLFANLGDFATNPFLINALHLQKLQLLQNLVLQVMVTNNTSPPPPNIDAMSLLGSNFLNPQNLITLQNLQTNLLDSSMMPNLSMINYGSCSSEGGREINGGGGGGGATTSYMTTPTATSTVTPENSEISTLKPLEDWDDLKLEDLDTDLGWKDILNQISWSDEP